MKAKQVALMKPDLEFVKFMGVKIDNLNYLSIRQKIGTNLNKKKYICLTDVGNVIAATRDRMLLRAINSSFMSVADGMPLVWYAKIAGCRNIERVSGINLLDRMLSEKNNFKHFLLGDTEETINRVIRKAKNANREVKIVGHSPPFKIFEEEDNKIIFDKINENNPDIVWVCFGGGKQEKWMYENIDRLSKGIMIGVGAAFRWYIGEIKMPPKFMQNLGLQWAFRTISMLTKDPKLIVERQLFRFPIFVVHFPIEVLRARKSSESQFCHRD